MLRLTVTKVDKCVQGAAASMPTLGLHIMEAARWVAQRQEQPTLGIQSTECTRTALQHLDVLKVLKTRGCKHEGSSVVHMGRCAGCVQCPTILQVYRLTSAARCRTSLLKSADLPTFGLPMMATCHHIVQLGMRIRVCKQCRQI